MAQTKRKRQTKHRGNAAGVVVSRGRTGRKPTAAEKGEGAKPDAREKRLDRLNKPPTWRGAFLRSAVAALLVLAIGLGLLKMSAAQALTIFPLVLVIYVPVSYYTDLLLYRRRQRKQAEAPARGRVNQ